MARETSASLPRRHIGVPRSRRRGARMVAAALEPGMRVALTTHVNADGDGVGSEIGLWHLLKARGVEPVIVNPTPFPPRYQFLLEDAEGADRSGRAVKELERADLVMVLDISDLGRLGHLAQRIEKLKVPVACIDHHQSNGSLPDGPHFVDAAACATGELVHDLARVAKWNLPQAAAQALYVAILTDTGGFRFSNTTPRALHLASHLLAHGLDPEQIYTRVYASAPEGRVRLVAEVLDTLVVELPLGLAWVTVPPGALERHTVTSDDLDGVVEFPRSILGVRLALLFRQIGNGRIKVSFRSIGDVDAAALAEQFGGGGHRRAAGASLEGTIAEVQSRVLAASRATLS